MANPLDLRTWLVEQCADYKFDVSGVFQRTSEESRWPLHAAGPEELEDRLAQGGHLLPLAEGARRAGERAGSVDRELPGRPRPPGTGGGSAPRHRTRLPRPRDQRPRVRRRLPRGRRQGRPAEQRNRGQTQSRITLYTGNTYFKWPDLHWPGTFRPFSSYATHLDVIMIYTLNPDNNARVDDLEIIVQEPWRIASRQRVLDHAGVHRGRHESRRPARRAGRVRDPGRVLRPTGGGIPFKVSPFVHTQLQRAPESPARRAG